MEPFISPSLILFYVRSLVFASNAGAGVVVLLMAFALSRVVALLRVF